MRNKAGWFVAGALAMLLIGQSGVQRTDVGRYQISSGDEWGIHFIIDTTTGETWCRSRDGQLSFGTPHAPAIHERSFIIPQIVEPPAPLPTKRRTR